MSQLTDPGSGANAVPTEVGVSCTPQIATVVKHKLVVEREVSSQVLD